MNIKFGKILVVFLISILLIFSLFTAVLVDDNTEQSESFKSELNETNDGSPWPFFQHDMRNTGRSQFASSHVNGSVKWEKDLDSLNLFPSSLVMDSNSNIYVGTDQHVISLNSEGNMRWRFNSSPDFGSVSSSMAVDDNDNIIVPGYTNCLYSIDSSGNLNWQFNTSYKQVLFRSPVIYDDKIIVGSRDLSNNSSILGGENDYLYCLNSDGTLDWKYHTKGGIGSTAVDSEGNIYFGTSDEHLYSLDIDGNLNWKFDARSPITGSPSIGDDGTIYFGTENITFNDNNKTIKEGDNYLYAVSSQGNIRWKQELNGRIRTTPTIGRDGTIYVGTLNNTFYAVNENGEIEWSYECDKEVSFSSVISKDGVIYFTSGGSSRDKSTLYALNENGTIRWTKKLEDLVPSPIIGNDGSIYLATTHGSKLISLGPSSPTVDITQPAKGEVIETKSVKLEWDNTTLGSNVDYFEVRLDGNDWEKIGSVNQYEFTDVAVGDHTAEVKAVAESNNYD
ncbi:MAG: PQQ-binding-like beta-propeller repeat protein, partial [Thermoplasmatota archaeon]